MGLQGLLAVFFRSWRWLQARLFGHGSRSFLRALQAIRVYDLIAQGFGHPHDGGNGTELPPRECTLQHTDDKSVGAYRTCFDHNASNPRRGVQQCEGWCWQRQLAPPSPCWTAIRHVLVLLQLTDACLTRDAARAYPAGQRRLPLYN